MLRRIRMEGRSARWPIVICILLLTAVVATAADDAVAPAPKTTDALLLDLAGSAFPAHKAAIEGLGRSRDMRVVPFLEDYNKAQAYLWNAKVVLKGNVQGETVELLDPLTRKPLAADGAALLAPIKDVKELDVGNRERRLVRDALTLLRLSDPDREKRLAAILRAGDSGADSNLPALTELLKAETDTRVHNSIEESIARIQLEKGAADMAGEDNLKLRKEAVSKLGELRSIRAVSRIKELAAAESNPDAKADYAKSIALIDRWQTIVDWVGYGFSGLSAGSILVLMALGLSIIFGLMGVINMAHGELMMIGAYATYETQVYFAKHLQSHFDWYFLLAIPISFLAAAIVGMLIEVLLIRRLYGRPLETLLATWGVGLVLIQMVRRQYGDNIGVNAPSYLQRGLEIAPDIVLPYARLFIIGFCVACILLMYWITRRTKLGLLLRATAQNREMAAALGVRTRRVDMLTFGLGAGLAGMAGCALTQIGGVTPDMGQNYIVDSFMVVVTGGVGKLAGAIWAGMGLGVLNKIFEPIVQTVWAKVLVLICVIIFIQWRPSGLFPAKGRLADA